MGGMTLGNVWICSDLHIGHKNIANFRKEITSEAHNREVIKYYWDKQVTKRDLVWVLGDAAFTEEAIDWIGALSGEKRLIRGNHDDLPTTSYLRTFTEIYGILKYKNMWLSHAPIHPDELRGKNSLHGHTHYQNMKLLGIDEDCRPKYIDDPRYLNCSVENLMRNYGSPLISLDQVRSYFK